MGTNSPGRTSPAWASTAWASTAASTAQASTAGTGAALPDRAQVVVVGSNTLQTLVRESSRGIATKKKHPCEGAQRSFEWMIPGLHRVF